MRTTKPLSRVTERFTESVIREMTRVCDAVHGINLAQGFPDFPCPPELKQAAVRAVEADLNQYPVTFGEPELREAIAAKSARHNALPCDPATEVTVTCGSTEAMIATLQAVLDPGDELVVFEPFYENYGPDGILSGASPRFVRLRAPDWRLDEEALKEAFGPRTKAIVLNSPNNPTGKVFTRDELRLVADLCRDHDAYAVTDEIYEHILYDGAEHVPLATLDGMRERTVTINSASKTYSVTGWRVGWAIAPAPVTQRIRKVHDFLTVGAPTPLQHAVAEALALPPTYYEALRTRYAEARTFLARVLRDAGFTFATPGGAYYVLADASELLPRLGAEDDVAFSRRLLERTGVATVPGSSFYHDPRDGRTQVRFAFCKRPETLQAVETAFRKLEA